MGGGKGLGLFSGTIGAEHSSPWNSWQNYPKVKVNGQSYALVGERLFSKHAVDRMQPSGNRFGPSIIQAGGVEGRSIAPAYVEYVIQHATPIYQPNTGNTRYQLGDVEVYLNPQGAVVTIITKH